MRTLITLFLLLVATLLYSQSFSYPVIQQKGQQIKDFVPPNWVVLDSAAGDLNKDRVTDVALVLQYKDSVTLIKKEGTLTDTVITQPRLLLVLFTDALTKHLTVAAKSNTFILNHDNPSMDDPFQDIKITNGLLNINFQLFYNMGSWYITTTSYKFRYQNGQLVLIGADHNSMHRATNEIENYSYNFLTKKRSYTTGKANSKKNKTTWKNLQLPRLKTLTTLQQPYTWEVEENVFL